MNAKWLILGKKFAALCIAGCGVHIPDAEEGVADIHPHRRDIPQRGGVQVASRDAAFPQVQGWDAAHDQVARARAYASVGRERHEDDFQKEKIVSRSCKTHRDRYSL